jgi:hypothetical protein
MKRSPLAGARSAFLIAILTSSPALAQLGARAPNWSVPSGLGRSRALNIESDIGVGGTALVPVTPCRIVDTRGPTGTFGGPSLAPGSPRNFPLLSGPCTGLPSKVLAYSLNITATNTAGTGFFKVFPQGAASPVVSTLNYAAGQTVANAAIVPAGTGSGITVAAGVAGADLLIDINGYFVGNGGIAPLNPGEYVGWQGNLSGGGIVFGWNTNASGIGVQGLSPGIGVFGTSSGSGLSLAGVWGQSTDAIGTYGFSTNTNGVWAQSATFDALAAFGGREGAYLQGHRNGAVSVTTGTASNTAGVIGRDGAGGPGSAIFFSAGVRGEGKIGVLGITNIGVAVAGEADSPATVGVAAFGNFTATGTKAFIEPHPTDPTLTIRYVALEGPEAGTYFRGTARTVNGQAVIEVPESFRIVTDAEGLTVQLTPVGELAQMAVMSEGLNQVVVRSSSDVTFHYQVNGIRRAFRDWQAVAEGDNFRPITPSQRMPGWLTEEAKRRLIANGTYNSDGTVNLETARRMGWTRVWQQQEDEARAAAERAREQTVRSPHQ